MNDSAAAGAPPARGAIFQQTVDLAALNALGRQLGELARPGDVIFLLGELGAGKTTLTQAIAAGLGVPTNEPVTSPTFGLIHEYPGRLPLYHLDLYRLGDDEDELLELGVEDYLYGLGVCVIEWPQRLGRLQPATRLEITLTMAGATHRHLNCLPHDPDPAATSTWAARLAVLK